MQIKLFFEFEKFFCSYSVFLERHILENFQYIMEKLSQLKTKNGYLG